MSSYLNNLQKTFNNSVKNQSATFFSQKRSVNSHASSSAASNSRTTTTNNEAANALKRKRPIIVPTPQAPKIVYSQPADSGQVRDLMSQVHVAITYLKDHEVALTAAELAQKLGIGFSDTLRTVLKDNERIHYDLKSDTYAFKPIHNIRSAQALLGYLSNQMTAQGLSVKELKDGWSGAIDVIGKLEAEREILVTRTKKDNQPRMVWKNDRSLDVDVEDEFKAIWHRIQIPEPAELPRALQEAGLKPTSVDPASIKKATTSNAQRKKPKRARVGRITNVHMSHIIKDFSGSK